MVDPHETLKTLFERALARSPAQLAVALDEGQLTFADLDRQSRLLAARLWERGLRPGDRIALLMRNIPAYPVADIAIARLGAVKVPLNEMLSAANVAYILEHAEASLLIVDPALLELARAALQHASDDVPVLEVRGQGPDEWHPQPERPAEPRPGRGWEAVRVDPQDPAVIFYTGGTTGRPKGVVHTHASLVANQYAQLLEGEVTPTDRLLLTTPLPHAAGLFLQASIIRGATAYIHTTFEPERVLREISTRGVTWTFLVPTMLYRLLDVPDATAYDTASLRTIVYGAAPISADRLEHALSVFGPVFVQLYAQTECPNWGTRLSKRDHLEAQERPAILGSCGKASIMARVRVVDDHDRPSAPGEIGEIHLQAPYLLDRYWKDPQATADKFTDDGWIRTGDLGTLDEDGYVYVKDRRADMIISGGMNVYSAEVESALRKHPGVADAAVIGVPHGDWGEAVHAIVVTSEAGIDEDDLRTFCTANLDRYARPKSFEITQTLPLTVYGKVDKKALRRPFWKDSDRQVH